MARRLKTFARVDVPILDDFGLSPLTAEQRRDLLEIVEDRYGRKATIVTSQSPVEHRHEIISDPTLADAILDRRCITRTGCCRPARACATAPPNAKNLGAEPGCRLCAG